VNPYNVLKRPILSEKSTDAREGLKQYTFEIDVEATKDDVRVAVEKILGAKVARVATLTTRGKIRRRGKHASSAKLKKKAIISLAQGQSLKLFEDQ
jgi:large subunit ribosomal protein L23